MKKLEVKDLKENFFEAIGKEWMLVTDGTKEKFNTMTASWGGIGWLWNKPVAFVFIRPERYTYEFVEKNDYLTLSFLGEENKKIHAVCGSKSGRNIDKVKKLLSMFEEKQLLYDILHAQKDESLAVTIGQENKYNDIKDCSIISATYHLDGKPIATLAVLGPTRMDYGKIISLLKFMNANLADIFHRFHL